MARTREVNPYLQGGGGYVRWLGLGIGQSGGPSDQQLAATSTLTSWRQLTPIRDALRVGDLDFPARCAGEFDELPELKGLIARRIEAPGEWPWIVRPGRGRQNARADELAAMAAEDLADMIPNESALDALLTDGLTLTTSLLSFEYVQRRGRWLPVLAWAWPGALRWDERADNYKIRLADGSEAEPGRGEFPSFVAAEMLGARNWSSGYLRANALLYLLSRWGVQDLAEFVSEWGRPIKVGYAPLGSEKDDERAYAATLDQQLRSGVVVCQRGIEPGNSWDFDIKQVQGSGEIITRLGDYVRQHTAILWLGHVAAAGGGSGSTVYTEQNAGNVSTGKRMLDCRWRSRLVTRIMFGLWTRINFGEDALIDAPEYTFVEPPKMTDGAGLSATVSAIGAAPPEVQALVDWQELFRRFGVPMIGTRK